MVVPIWQIPPRRRSNRRVPVRNLMHFPFTPIKRYEWIGCSAGTNSTHQSQPITILVLVLRLHAQRLIPPTRYFIAKQGFHSRCILHSSLRITGLVLKSNRILGGGVVGLALGLTCYMDASSTIKVAQMTLMKNVVNIKNRIVFSLSVILLCAVGSVPLARIHSYDFHSWSSEVKVAKCLTVTQ